MRLSHRARTGAQQLETHAERRHISISHSGAAAGCSRAIDGGAPPSLRIGAIFRSGLLSCSAGSVAAAINVLATLPAYNVLDVNVQTGQGLLASLRPHPTEL